MPGADRYHVATMPLDAQPAYARYAAPGGSPVAARLAQRVLSLPMSADLTEADQDLVAHAVKQALQRSSR